MGRRPLKGKQLSAQPLGPGDFSLVGAQGPLPMLGPRWLLPGLRAQRGLNFTGLLAEETQMCL